MIKIVVETEDEARIVRDILKEQACGQDYCKRDDNYTCSRCVAEYCHDKVKLYKRETVEVPVPFVLS